VQLVEIDSLDAESRLAVFARRHQVLGPPVALPSAVRPDDADPSWRHGSRSIALPCREGARDQALVVSALALVPAVRVAVSSSVTPASSPRGAPRSDRASSRSRSVERRIQPMAIGRICQGPKVNLSLAPCSSRAPDGGAHLRRHRRRDLASAAGGRPRS
jgi:hypothetical protein